MQKYTKAEPGPNYSVIYLDEFGKQWQFSGGTRCWRNQNPGNLVPGKISKRNGAIGKAAGFAVFPNYESGHAALVDSLKSVYRNKTIPVLMESYAPPHENKTAVYIRFLLKKIGIKRSKKVRDFSPTEFEKLWKAIEKMEGWKEGKIIEYKSKALITAVVKDEKGIIQEYCIDGFGWVSKQEGIRLTQNGKVDAVVATSPRGNLFLRARPNQEVLDNLENKG